jgi:hypothetical protein
VLDHRQLIEQFLLARFSVEAEDALARVAVTPCL